MSKVYIKQEKLVTIKKRKKDKMLILTIFIYAVALIYFFPILYMLLSGFKTEYQAVKPSLFFYPTIETFIKVLSDRNMYGYLQNSIFQVLTGTIICLALGVPAAFILVFGKFKKKGTGEK